MFNRYVRNGEIDLAIGVFKEAGRADLVSGFSPEDLAKVAHFQEKQLDYQGAAKTHERLFKSYGQSHEGERSLVRLVMLHKGKMNDPAALRHWLEVANQELRSGGWRNYLEEEFRTEGGFGANDERDLLQSSPRQSCLPKP